MTRRQPASIRAVSAVIAATALGCSLVGCSGCSAPTGAGSARTVLVPAVRTEAVPHDADDPAVWIDPVSPGQSLIIATDKFGGTGGLYVFGLDGRIRQAVTPLDRPNNVDVEYGLSLAGGRIDIAVVTERNKHRLRVYRIDPVSHRLNDVSSGGGIPVLNGQSGGAAEPMGIGLYRRPRDGAVFAIISPKTGPRTGYLWQYRLEDDGAGKVKGTYVRRFGNSSGTGEIEAVAVDDAPGFVYYADEEVAIRKWHADPDNPQSASELAVFAVDGFAAQREGIGIFRRPDGAGEVAAIDQTPGSSTLHLFRRDGSARGLHDHSETIKVVATGADDTDGIEVVDVPLGPAFPHGALVAMNSRGRNFLLFRWEDVIR